ncbi:MAG: glycerophosphodiester phosphodiesterase, partial [Pseudomonadota bacterium]|nr:glycerophosphodiester phosphodiesterase [Pseudomonadota bacterium]
MAAFEAAVATGVNGIETDVRLSLDGLPVLIH